jgi:hypothetical protein
MVLKKAKNIDFSTFFAQQIYTMPTQALMVLAVISAVFAQPVSPIPSSVKEGAVEMAEEPPSILSASLFGSAKRGEVDEKEDILWLARIIYSETHVESEMPLIAWVVRNRVETGFRGTTYKEVALSKNQFSGLNATDPHYARNISVGYEQTNNRTWQRAVAVAEKVYNARASERPFPQTVRHFYSPVAIGAPRWAEDHKLYRSVGEDGEAARFAFYADVR